MVHSNDYIGGNWQIDQIADLGDLQRVLTQLTAEQLDFVCPKLVEWRERAIELQHEPAMMAAAQMQHWEEQTKLKDAWERYQRDEISQEMFEGVVAELVEVRRGR